MIFEISGIKVETGERIKAKVKSNSLEDAIALLIRKGITPRPGSNMSVSAGTEPDSRLITAKSRHPSEINATSATAYSSTTSRTKHCSTPTDALDNADPSNPAKITRRQYQLAASIISIAVIVATLAITFNSSPESSILHTANQAAAGDQLALTALESVPTPPPIRPIPPNVIRSEDGKLSPAPGFTWVSASPDNLSVRWVSGNRHPAYSNISSGQKEGFWVADAGYAFTSKDSLSVQWQPGARDPDHPNLEAGDSPGKWHPLPGFTWIYPDDPKSLSVTWKAGVPHPTASYVVSGSAEGNWRPASGFRWASDIAGDLSVVRAGPSKEQLQSALSMVVLALLFDEAGNRANDGSLGGAFVHDLMKGGRNDAIRKAISDLFPNESQLTVSAAANIIILGADGRLTADDWTSATARDALIARIREEDPSVANAYQLAEFIGSVLDTYEQRRQ
ncbi:MAG: hypothetical protein HS101_08070 [Planctomycetia bacterium]|nr:hypothetical protein [Planctomycetia bacterium]